VPANLAHINTWVFDLDNTLYPATTHLFPQIDRRMKAFISDALKMSLADAFKLQKRYYWTYGTTLRGLMLNHNIEPDGFLDYVHDIDHSVVAADPRLDSVLARLPGRKFIYTNGSERHAVNVMDRLGVAKHFTGIFDIIASSYIPKPDPAAYVDFVERHAINPRQSIMFEDIHLNLKPAADLGMTTVWVKHAKNPPKPDEDLSHCSFITNDMIAWLESAAP
jgi:putative hydrolase of the HAD superfamily